ncbi:MAG: HAMP domain-containing histidine kinase [Clostridiales bacterium]|nr:HAMP domain-containing histidine kinase [Clostridiales bacterium]
MSSEKNNPDIGGKFKSSIAHRLNVRLGFRLIRIFLYLDIVILIVAGISAVTYSERCAGNAAERIIQFGAPDISSDGWLELSGLSIEVLKEKPEGIAIPGFLQSLFPKRTAAGVRKIVLEDGTGAAFPGHNAMPVYKVGFEYNGRFFSLSVRLTPLLSIFKSGFIALLIIELLVVLSGIPKNARLIRRTLDPIAEFARVAQDLNTVSRNFDSEKMEALTGKLEGINASKLDTRIIIDETQEELRNLARAINGMLDRINESYRAQVRFVSDASHELRTPISVIQGYANLLDRWGKNDQKTLQESITAIKDETSSMKDLIEQLLFLARGDNNTIMLQPEIFELSELADEVISESRMVDSTRKYEVESADVAVSADRALIKQAMRILVDNAIKYTESGGLIKITVTRENMTARLTVQDDGIGIHPDVLPYVFDRFYRAEQSRARATGGAGLGLSIAKWIISRHGGYMEVLSREGLGTRITIALASVEGAPAISEVDLVSEVPNGGKPPD